jgi:hypothetical protein
MSNFKIDIALVDGKRASSATSTDYAPFGVKMLKLQIRKQAGPAQKVWLRAKRFQRDVDPGVVYSLADDGDDLWVIWGAGDRVGFCAKYAELSGTKKAVDLDDDAPHTVYLHMFHRPTDPTTYTLRDYALTVTAVAFINGAMTIVAERAFRLTVPRGLVDPLRFVWEWGADVSRIRLLGAEAPRYHSRWWPARALQYQAVPETPRITLEYTRAVANGPEGKIMVWLEKETGREPLAEIAGHLTWPLYDLRWVQAELYRFHEDHLWALRIWFFWVDAQLDGNDLLTYVPPAHQEALSPRRAQEAQQLMQPRFWGAWPGWEAQYEIPDIERFDIVFNPVDLNLKYGCTDAHWKEFWFAVENHAPCQCHIAAPGEALKVVADFVQKHLELSGKTEPPPITNPLEDSGVAALIASNLLLDSGFVNFNIETDMEKTSGFLGKNAPRVENSNLLETGLSSDVLAG